MRWPVRLAQVVVVFRSLIAVRNPQCQRRTSGLVVDNTRQDLKGIRLVTLCSQLALAGAPATELMCNLRHIKPDIGWATIDHNTNPCAMRLAKGRNAKKLSKTVSGHMRSVCRLK